MPGIMTDHRAFTTAVAIGGDGDPVIRGQMWAGGVDWVILIHDLDQDLDAWSNLSPVLAADGYTVLAVDLPGHGLSDDPWQPDAIARCVAQAASFATHAGAARCFLVVTGAISAPSMVAARDLAHAVVALSPRIDDEGLRALRDVRVPALVLVGAADTVASDDARRVFQDKAGWTVLSTFGAADNGSALLAGPWGTHVREQILTFLRDYRSPSAPAAT